MKTLTETKPQKTISKRSSLTPIVAVVAKRRFLRVAVTGVTLFLLATSASLMAAEAAPIYRGTLTSGDFFCDGELLVPPPHSVTGSWRLIIDQTPAQFSLRIFYENRRHLAFSADFELVSFIDGVYVFSGFENAATVTLDTHQTPAAFSYHVELGYSCPDEYPYSSLTYYGVADRRGN